MDTLRRSQRALPRLANDGDAVPGSRARAQARLPLHGDSSSSRSAHTLGVNGISGEVVTPELALVDPYLARAQRNQPDRKASMFFTVSPSNGTPKNGKALDTAKQALQPTGAELPVKPQVTGDRESMLDVPLGTLVLREGLVAEEQLEVALVEHMRTGKRLGEVLLERGWLHERDLGRLLAAQRGLPFVDVTAADAESPALRLLAEETARLQIALPLWLEDDGELLVAVADPSNEVVLENLRRALGFEPQLVVAPLSELVCAIGVAYGALAPEAASEDDGEAEAEPSEVIQLPTASQTAKKPAPAIVPPFRPLVPEQAAQDEEVPADSEPDAPAAAAVSQPSAAPVEEQPAATGEAPAPEEQPPATGEAPAPEEQLPPAAEAAEPAEPPAEPEDQSDPDQPADDPSVGSVRHLVRLRLSDGDLVEIGSFGDASEAGATALDAVRRITAAEADATWPLFAGRFLRPDTIISVEISEETADEAQSSEVELRLADAAS
jgi:MshEN domain